MHIDHTSEEQNLAVGVVSALLLELLIIHCWQIRICLAEDVLANVLTNALAGNVPS